MVSLIVSREFSFHFNLDDEQLELVLKDVNEKRKTTKYINSKAAIAAHNSDVKKELAE